MKKSEMILVIIKKKKKKEIKQKVLKIKKLLNKK